ncbi:cell division cycle 45 (CDC45) [Novymonas esmeraldas]|uniref:Cell division cycle 45 (CDC45) n=1 Tax=Novymonas esmeraldas TaxID=1808958 RepID=A0AAW0F466_9TRYP
MATASGAPEPWDRITHYYAVTRKSVNVLVAPTSDAAAASLSLAYLMKVFLLPFKLHPTSSYDELTHFLAQTNAAQDSEREEADSGVRVDDLFVLVGLGAPVPLSDYFDFSRHVVIVVDAFRPMHLANLRREDGDRLVIWGSDRIQAEVDDFFRRERVAEARRRRRHRRRQDVKRGRRAKVLSHVRARRQRTEDDGDGDAHVFSDESSISASSTEDEEDEDSSTDTDTDEDGDADLFDGVDDDATPSQSQDHVDWRGADGQLSAHLEALYYSCACAGRSSAVEVYDLSVILHRFNDAVLWHAAVGVCDLYLRRLIDYSAYLVEMAPLQEAVALQQSVRRGVLRDRTEEAVNSHHRSFTNSMQLSSREEEQLYLLRHTTLWDAIWYHPQVASALDLHHVEDGRPRLSQLLASRCGVSIAMAQRPWCEVPADVGSDALQRVQAELQSLVNARGNTIAYRNRVRCVSRKVGYSTEVSTFDVCRLFTAEIAATPPASVYVVERAAEHAGLAHDDAAAAAVATSQRRLMEFQRGRFWRARAVLDMDPNEKPFHEALSGALALQQAVADATSAMMQPGHVQSSTGLHYALPADPSKTPPALETFCTMRRLSVLAERLYFTLSMSRRRDRQAAATLRPLILSCALPQPRLTAPLAQDGSGTLPSAGAAATSPPTGGGGLVGGVAQAADSAEYAVVLTHGGNVGAGMLPLPPVHRFVQCMQDEHFSAPPRQLYVERGAAQLRGRENATYLAERMLLLSVKASIPRADDLRAPSPTTADYAEEEEEEAYEEDAAVEVVD